MKRLVFLSPALSGGGIEASIAILLESLKLSENWTVTWVGINDSHVETNLQGIVVHCAGRRSKDGLKATLASFLKIRKFLGNDERTIFVVNGEAAECFAMLFLRKSPLVVVEHASHPWKMAPVLGYVIRTILNRRKTKWVTVNSGQELIWPRVSNFSLIPNPVVNTYNPRKGGSLGLLFIGRLVKEKGIDLVLELAKKCNLSLDVFGDGELLGPLKNLYKADRKVTFHGFVSNPWMRVNTRQLLIGASHHEGDGRVIAEAIVFGQPLMLLSTQDYRRFGLPERNYFRDIEELAEAVVKNSGTKFQDLRPPKQRIIQEAKYRDAARIASEWKSIIQDVGEKTNL